LELRLDFLFSDGLGWPAGEGGTTARGSAFWGAGVRGTDFPLSLAGGLLFPTRAEDIKSLKTLFMMGVREARMSARKPCGQ